MLADFIEVAASARGLTPRRVPPGIGTVLPVAYPRRESRLCCFSVPDESDSPRPANLRNAATRRPLSPGARSRGPPAHALRGGADGRRIA